MTAGATGTVLTNPLWVVKTRFMVSRAPMTPTHRPQLCLRPPLRPQPRPRLPLRLPPPLRFRLPLPRPLPASTSTSASTSISSSPQNPSSSWRKRSITRTSRRHSVTTSRRHRPIPPFSNSPSRAELISSSLSSVPGPSRSPRLGIPIPQHPRSLPQHLPHRGSPRVLQGPPTESDWREPRCGAVPAL
jgi:hypothetical protein